MLGYRQVSLFGTFRIHVGLPLPAVLALLAGMGVLLVRVQVHPLGETFQADEAQVGLLPAVNQLVSLQLGRGGEALVAKFAGVLFLKLFFEEGQLLQSWERVRAR